MEQILAEALRLAASAPAPAAAEILEKAGRILWAAPAALLFAALAQGAARALLAPFLGRAARPLGTLAGLAAGAGFLSRAAADPAFAWAALAWAGSAAGALGGTLGRAARGLGR